MLFLQPSLPTVPIIDSIFDIVSAAPVAEDVKEVLMDMGNHFLCGSWITYQLSSWIDQKQTTLLCVRRFSEALPAAVDRRVYLLRR